MKSNKNHYFIQSINRKNRNNLPFIVLLIAIFSTITLKTHAQINKADRSGFTWIATENISDKSFGAGYTLYSAAWPTFDKYPGLAYQDLNKLDIFMGLKLFQKQ